MKLTLKNQLDLLVLEFKSAGNYSLVGGIPTPLKNVSSSVGMMKFPTEWEKKKGLKPPTSIGSCFCVDFVLHCRRFVCTGGCILLKKVISKWSCKIDKRVYRIPRNMRYILTKLKREHRTYTQQKLNWIHSMHSLPEFPMFFPWFSRKKMTRLHRRPGFRFHLWHRPQRKGWDDIAWTILVGGFNPYEKCSKPPTSIISLIHGLFFMTLRWKPDMFLFMYLMLMLLKVSICNDTC